MDSTSEKPENIPECEIPQGYIKKPEFPKKKKIIIDEELDILSLSNLKAVQLTQNDGVAKFVQDDILEYESLKKGSKVNIIFDPYFPDGKLVPIEGRNRKEKISFRIKKDLDICPGLDIATSSLKLGEKAIFKINSEYHSPGRKGTAGLIAEDTFLYYRIELVHLETPNSLEPDAIPEDLLTFLRDCKGSGNKFFTKSEYDNAEKEYSKAIKVLASLPKKLVGLMKESEKEETLNLEICIKNNSAMCLIKKECYRDAIKLLNVCIEKDPKNVKAWYRRALCFKNVGDYNNSEADFIECCKLDPSMHSHQKEFISEAESIKKKNQINEKKLYEKIFQKLPEEEEREAKEQREKRAIERKIARDEKQEEDSYK